jgi:hypothetical protein
LLEYRIALQQYFNASALRLSFGALACGYTPVDLDTFAMDNSSTKKELVGSTYAGADGYCPFAVYLGSLGYCLELALRPGVQHSAAESQYNFERALPMAASLVSGSMLVRADSGFDSLKLFREITAQADALGREIAFLIKWNPRRAPVEAIAGAKVADTDTQWMIHRPGKSECIWQEALELADVGSQASPVRHAAKRRRIKTVMQEMMFKAARMIKHAERWIFGLRESDSGFAVFERHYGQLKTG